MQRITIENFGPITYCELEVQDFLLFIGPQASGKSTISKSIYFFKSLRDDLIKFLYEAFEDGNTKKPLGTFGKRIRSKFLKFWGSTYHLSNIFLKYEFKKDIWISITLEPNHKFVQPDFSKDFLREFNNIIQYARNVIDFKVEKNVSFFSANELLEKDIEKRKFLNTITSMANELFGEYKELVFVPAGRSLLATLSEQLQLVNVERLDYLMTAFVERINKYKPYFNKSLGDLVTEKKLLTQDIISFKIVDLAKEKISQILKGEYRYDSEGEKIYVSQGKYTKLGYSSSGQQEVIWILNLLFLLILDMRKVFIVIEEPEAHLFPEAQKSLMELITLLANIEENQIIITTHSPYVLSSINNLLYADKVGRKQDKKEKVSKRINPSFWLDQVRLGSYLVNNGKIEDIKDYDLELIKTETIDSASRIINDEYYFLFNLEE